jgi:O-methyltransferase involved in polyketide biosynthesis
MFRAELKRLIRKYPEALCINLGCGFDDKFSQVDNGKITWFDVDLPDQIAVRRKVYEDRERCTMLEEVRLRENGSRTFPKAI